MSACFWGLDAYHDSWDATGKNTFHWSNSYYSRTYCLWYNKMWVRFSQIIIINVIFYSTFQGTSQSALHRRKDWEKTIITIKSKINIFHMTQENHLKAILKKKCFKNRFKNTKRFSLSDLRRKRVPEFWCTRRKGSPIDRRRVGGITKRPESEERRSRLGV